MKQRNSQSYEARDLFNMSLGSGGGRSVCLWCCRLLSVPLRAGLRKEVGLLRPGPGGLEVLRHQMVRWNAGGTEYPRWWHRQIGRPQFGLVSKLDKYATLSFAMTNGLANDSDKFKITITLRRVEEYGDLGFYKNFQFLFSPSVPKFFFYNFDTFFMKQRNSLSYEARNLLKMSLGSGGGRSVCLMRCRFLSVPLREQASVKRWDCSGLDHVVRRCFGTEWNCEVPGARSTRDGDTGK